MMREVSPGVIELPKRKQEEDIDITIAHWGIFAPGRSGMYETLKELIIAENEIPGVIAGFVNPEKPKGGDSDGWISVMPHSWAVEQATIHVSSYFMTGYSTMQKPRVMLIHGTPEACYEAEKESGAFISVLGALQNLDASIVMNHRQHDFWKPFDHRDTLHYVDKGIDLTRFTPTGMRIELNGEPAVGIGEVERKGGVKLPLLPLWALNEYYKENEKMRLHYWGIGNERDIMDIIVNKSNFDRFLGKYRLLGWQSFPENWYRGLDMVISPSMYGDPSRVNFESMACGCPVIDWDSSARWNDTFANMHARALDPIDMKECVAKLYDKIRADKAKVRAETRAIAEQHYDIRQTAKQIVSILRKVQDEVGSK